MTKTDVYLILCVLIFTFFLWRFLPKFQEITKTEKSNPTVELGECSKDSSNRYMRFLNFKLKEHEYIRFEEHDPTRSPSIVHDPDCALCIQRRNECLNKVASNATVLYHEIPIGLEVK